MVELWRVFEADVDALADDSRWMIEGSLRVEDGESLKLRGQERATLDQQMRRANRNSARVSYQWRSHITTRTWTNLANWNINQIWPMVIRRSIVRIAALFPELFPEGKTALKSQDAIQAAAARQITLASHKYLRPPTLLHSSYIHTQPASSASTFHNTTINTISHNGPYQADSP